MNANPRAVTLDDVARASGVSTATVSRYRRGVRRFAPELAARIDAAIQALGYSDNLQARNVATGRSGIVGVVVLDLHNPHFTALVRGAQQVAQAQARSVALVDTAESRLPERQLVEALSRRVDGLVVSSRLAGGDVEWVTQLGKPVVFFGRPPARLAHAARVPSVGVDGEAAARLLAEHLVAAGCRRVAYLGYAASLWSRERARVLAETLALRGVAFAEHEVAAPDAAAGQAVAAPLLLGADAAARPDAVVGYNDLIALGLLHEALRLGLAVPQQLKVAGFDDIEAARHVVPALTSVAMHSLEQGAQAMRRLLRLIDGGDAGDASGAPHEALPPRLMLRASTQPTPLSAPASGAPR